MSETQRIDKWLWFARFLKSRSLATTLAASGRLRLNGQLIAKAHQQVKAGDVLTFPLGPHIRVIKVLDPGTRRGPAPEAQTLYEDLSPPPPREKGAKAAPDGAPPQREAGSGRPTKRERRALDHLMNEDETD
ncbi:RNA-binding S4 domain-containing protein [Dongia rigui]|uniref:RNA-binding S4 domain-containing protein n=1 Tax=Dongia rigui TaxID=940149 RepID=A0ABU5DWW1_9PROT|nr:RNA-binding S4 domain-containing protein [Dongia rigui]MDY0871796.1 RNA-binding S4 domain-containing protein [Dongia rigui]